MSTSDAERAARPLLRAPSPEGALRAQGQAPRDGGRPPRPSPGQLVAAEALQVVLAEVQPPALPWATRAVLQAQPHGAGGHHHGHRGLRRRRRLAGPPHQREVLRVPQHGRQLLGRGPARQPPPKLALLQAAAAGTQHPQSLDRQRHGQETPPGKATETETKVKAPEREQGRGQPWPGAFALPPQGVACSGRRGEA